MNILKSLALTLIVALATPVISAQHNHNGCEGTCDHHKKEQVVVGAARTELYLPLLKGKRVALLSNQTGTVDGKHVLDIMIENGINVVTIFSPEHGFRGTADAGEHVSSSVDEKTGVPIKSLYDGGLPMPSKESMSLFDVVVYDLQDVGLRYYTYYVTMCRMMDACIIYNKEMIVLDRPNPNIMYVDGPILDMSLKSGVGFLPIPTVYGMTLGELAKMAMGEGWLKDGKTLPLTVVPCDNYTRHTRYRLPIAPSPNLPNMLSVYLYPSICYFEGTPVSLGRGTDWPFQVYGHPAIKHHEFSFTPESRPGAKTPPRLGELCYGTDLHNMAEEDAIAGGIDLTYVIDAYHSSGLGEEFFTKFFDKLMGRSDIKQMIMDGKTAVQIKASWAADVEKFKKQRAPYLIYKD
ncbi:MAG: DUF1343 domain-containing protein [Bacteroidales bacterium]|nr:DUF1343 domain-containing protein [Candidatus Sodaliphilus fimicaballi]